MKVYSCMGSPFNDVDGGVVYFRTKEEALKVAREVTASRDGAEGAEAIVHVYEVREPVTSERIVAMMNREGWAASNQVIAAVRNGRVTVRN